MFVKFPSISGLHNVCKATGMAVDGGHLPDGRFTYNAKVKLNGTNAGVTILNGNVFPQSRTRVLDNCDNAGFAAWVRENEAMFAKCGDAGTTTLTIFGEWCGQGIMKGTALNQIDRKIFAVFMVMLGHVDVDEDDFITITDPDNIAELIPTHPDIFVLPYISKDVKINFGDRGQLLRISTMINGKVLEIEEEDPWVKETFGVSGIGEGLVFTLADSLTPRFKQSKMAFKVKGAKHSVVKSKTPASIDPAVLESVEKFVEMFVTPNRLEQGVREVANGELEFDEKMIGPFIGWVGKDVHKESVVELEASYLEWKQVASSVNTAARTWYLEKLRTL